MPLELSFPNKVPSWKKTISPTRYYIPSVAPVESKKKTLLDTSCRNHVSKEDLEQILIINKN